MLFSSTLLFQQAVLLASIAFASGLGLLYLRWRGHTQLLQSLRLPLLGFAVFGVCDALVTLHGTWQAPWHEGNPSMRAFLVWGGWWGQCLGSALWILIWTLVLDGMESLRCSVSGWKAVLVSWLQLWTIYALALGHLNGFVSWSDTPYTVAAMFMWFYIMWSTHASWLKAISPFGYPLYSGLCFGGICALLHTLTATLYRRYQSIRVVGF